MSIDYKDVQETLFTISAPTTTTKEVSMWSKNYQWRVIGVDLLVETAPATGAGIRLMNGTTTISTVASGTSTAATFQDLATSAAGTTFEFRVAGDQDALVQPETSAGAGDAEVITVQNVEGDASAVIHGKLIHSRTSG